MRPIDPPDIQEIREARQRLTGLAVRTPLIPLDQSTSEPRIYLKLENLQPIGSFKLRGAGNAMRSADPSELTRGVYTASAGNMAQGLAWVARELGIPCRRCHVTDPNHVRISQEDIDVGVGVGFDQVAVVDSFGTDCE